MVSPYCIRNPNLPDSGLESSLPFCGAVVELASISMFVQRNLPVQEVLLS